MTKNIKRNVSLEQELIKMSQNAGERYVIPTIIRFIDYKITLKQYVDCDDAIADKYALSMVKYYYGGLK